MTLRNNILLIEYYFASRDETKEVVLPQKKAPLLSEQGPLIYPNQTNLFVLKDKLRTVAVNRNRMVLINPSGQERFR